MKIGMKLARPFAHFLMLCLTLAALCRLATAQRPAPGLILYGGKIFTSVASQPYVQALAIRADRIVATGETAHIRSLAVAGTKQINLGGRTVIPGIDDAHNHVGVLPSNWYECQFQSPDPVSNDVKKALAAAAASQAKGTWLFAQIGPTIFTTLPSTATRSTKSLPHIP